jgi:hypothetical protein
MRRLLLALLVLLAAATPAAAQVINAESVRGVTSAGAATGPRLFFCTGDPEGGLVAAPGSFCLSDNGYLYWKAVSTGTDNSGWLNLRLGSALSLLGRSANSSGLIADITASAGSDCVFRESSSTLGCGTVATAGIANNAVTLAKLATIADLKLLGNVSGGAAVPSALSLTQWLDAAACAIDGKHLGRDSGTWGCVDDEGGSGSGTGDVEGPASAVDGNLALFDGTTGKLIKDGGNRYTEALATKTSDYTAGPSDSTILCDASSAAVTITLPAVSGLSGRVYTVIKIDSSTNACTIDPNSTELVNGASTLSTTVQYTSYTIIANGTAWYIK